MKSESLSASKKEWNEIWQTKNKNMDVSPHGLVVDLGCGDQKVSENAVGVDLNPETADVTHDLNKYPYPVETGSCREVYMLDVLEHLENPLKTVDECWRMLKPYGELNIIVPLNDPPSKNPFHQHEFKEEWFKSFDPDKREFSKRKNCDHGMEHVKFYVETRKTYHNNPKDMLLSLIRGRKEKNLHVKMKKMPSEVRTV